MFFDFRKLNHTFIILLTTLGVLIIIACIFIIHTNIDVSNKRSNLIEGNIDEMFEKAKYFIDVKNLPDSALKYLTFVTSLSEAENNNKEGYQTLYISSYNARGAIFASVYGNYSEAALNFIKGIELAKTYGNKAMENRLTYNIKALEYEQGQLIGNEKISKKTLKEFAKILVNLSQKKDIDLIVPLVLSITEISIREKEYNKGCTILQHISNPDKKIQSIKNILKNLSNNDIEKALIDTENAIATIDTTENIMNTAFLNNLRLIKSHILLQSGQEKEATDSYNKLIDNSPDNLFMAFEIYQYLQKYYEEKGDYRNGQKYELLKFKTKDRLINRSASLSLESAEAKYNVQKLEKEVNEELQQGKIYKKIFIISIYFLLVVLSLLCLLYYKYKQLSRTRNIIVRNNLDYLREDKSVNEPIDSTLECKNSDKKIFENITEVIKNNSEIYEEDFNIGRLADLAGLKPTKLSSIIKEFSGDTTSIFLARIRIREACKRINDNANYGDYTLEAIGQSVGYRSRSHFSSIFKKFVGMTPSEYASKVKKMEYKG